MSGHIVFVRFFPGYSGAFPYGRIVHLKDSDIKDSLESLGQEWLGKAANRQRVDALRREREEARETLALRIREWGEGALFRPGRNRGVPGDTPPEVEAPQANRHRPPDFEEIAVAAGWRGEQGFEEFAPYCISGRYPVARVKDRSSASALIEALQVRVVELAGAAFQHPRRRQDHPDFFFATANPRFFVIAGPALTRAEMLITGEQIQRIRGEPTVTPSTEEGYLRGYWPTLLPILEQFEKSVDPVDRLVFDDASQSILMDGSGDHEQLTPEGYQFLKTLGTPERLGTMVPSNEMKGAGLNGKKLIRVIRGLPRRWSNLIKSRKGAGGGYCLTLPPKSCP